MYTTFEISGPVDLALSSAGVKVRSVSKSPRFEMGNSPGVADYTEKKWVWLKTEAPKWLALVNRKVD